MKKKMANRSIIWQLLLSTISIFILMLFVSSYLINLKQTQMTNEFVQQIEKGLVHFTNKNDSTLILDATQTQTLSEYRVYVGFVMIGSILIGSALLTLVIVRTLRPLKTMTNTINQIDINNILELQKDIGDKHGSKELQELAESFQKTLNKIYENYEKQKQFSINVAHELRTPLAVLLTKVDVFKKQYTPMDPEILRFTDVLQSNIERLSKLVEDILFLSRDHAPKSEDVSIRELCEEVVLDLEDKAEQKQIFLSVSGNDIQIKTDDILLERAVYNLVDNAIKYTQPGGQCEIKIDRDAKNFYIHVIDNGPGIPENQKQSIFDLFYRMEDSRNRETGGYGIGLALVRDIVQRMNGTIQVFDHKPRGSHFQIQLHQKGTQYEE